MSNLIMSELGKYVNNIVICPKCGKPGILVIKNERKKYKDKVYTYTYIVVVHGYTTHRLGRLNEETLKLVKELKVVNI